jgi:hypothetical protein
MRHADIAEARDLEWYFSVGISAFERSPTGGMLDRAALLAVPRPPPRRVNGLFTSDAEPITAPPGSSLTNARSPGSETCRAACAGYGSATP